jgi:hypothetical protein
MRNGGRKSGRSVPPFLVACFGAIMLLGNARAEAQFGYGGGYGGFGFGFNYHPPVVDFLNQRSLLNASQATMGPVANDVYAGRPNAYVNHLHDAGFLDKWDTGTRRQIESSIGRYSDGPPPSYLSTHREIGMGPIGAPAPVPANQTPPAAVPANPTPPAPPALPLSSFFDRYQKLVWPGEAPTFGELGAKRAIADQACLAVLNDYNLHGLAQLSTVTDARTKLIEYGKPALLYLTENSTPRIADTFHLFLLSLYESLAQAATFPRPPAPTPSPAANPIPNRPPPPASPAVLNAPGTSKP